MSALENGKSAFQKRSEEAIGRRKVPAETGSAIQLPDLNKQQQTSPDVDGEQKPENPDKKFLTILPGEVPEAPDGGDYVTDPSADMAASGAFAYQGLKIRPVTPEEYAQINAITADPKLRKEKGPRRLADLIASPAPGQDAAANPQTPEQRQNDLSIPVEQRLGLDHSNRTLENDIDPNLFQKYNDNAGASAGLFWHPHRVGETYTPDEAERIKQYYAARQPRSGPTGPRLRQAGEPDLRDDLDRHRDDFVRDHGGGVPPPEQPPAESSHRSPDGGPGNGESPLVGPRAPQGPDIAMPSFYRKRDVAAILASPAMEDAPTFDVILQNPKYNELMGEFMKLRGREDLVIKYSADAASMSVDEQQALRALRLEFGNRIALAEEASSYLMQEDVNAMLKNPAFGLFADTLRPERAMQVIKERGIPLLFIRESNDTINHMILSQRALQGIRSGPRQKYYVNLRERVRRRAGTSGRPEHLDPQVMHHVLGKSMLEWLTFRGPGQVSVDRGRTVDTLNSITDNMSSVSNILAASISSDPEILRRAVHEARSGNAMPGLGNTGESTYTEMKRTENTYKVADEKQEFNKFKQGLRTRGIDTNNLSPADETSYFNDFAQQREASHGRGGERRGWFAILLDAFFSRFLTQNRQQFKFKEA